MVCEREKENNRPLDCDEGSWLLELVFNALIPCFYILSYISFVAHGLVFMSLLPALEALSSLESIAACFRWKVPSSL